MGGRTMAVAQDKYPRQLKEISRRSIQETICGRLKWGCVNCFCEVINDRLWTLGVGGR